MKDFPSCFGENGVQVADSSSSSTARAAGPQNLVTCLYRCDSQGFSGFITVTWIKYLMGQGVSIDIENSTKECLCRAEIKPWLFSTRKGFKRMIADSIMVDIHWDLSSAKFGSSPEPLEEYYLSIAINRELCLILGDLEHKTYTTVDPTPSISRATFVAKREHIFGKKSYNSKAQFCDKGHIHDIRIEYDASTRFDNCLLIYIDKEEVLQVTHLKWKFRGNQTIFVDGVSVDVYWDVHSWLFGTVNDQAIFLFRSCLPGDKLSSILQSPAQPSTLRSKYTHSQVGGFSLVLCVWKNK